MGKDKKLEKNVEKAVAKAADKKDKEATIMKLPVTGKQVTSGWLKAGFKAFLLEHEGKPLSVFHFARHLNMDEKDFYVHFNTLESLESDIWASYFQETMSRLNSDEVYNTYTIREKLLAFYFTLVEVLKDDRSYVVFSMKKGLFPKWTPEFMKEFKKEFSAYIQMLIQEGKETKEIAHRPFISDQYEQGLWLQLLFVLNFWARDDSMGFEKTDAAIEKAVNFSFDLMGKTALDSMFDLAKFLYESWKY